MEMFPIFAIGLGVENSPEGLPFARKMFEENKKLFNPVTNVPEHTTTLIGYKRKNSVAEHKNTLNLQNIKKLIHENALNFFVGCGYDITNYDLEIANLWLNEMQQSDAENIRHIHYGHQISGCYYVDMPKNTGGIVFTNNDLNIAFGSTNVATYTIFNSKTWQINPREGDMFFWKSDLPHQVSNGKYDGVRRTIAFDLNVIEKTFKE